MPPLDHTKVLEKLLFLEQQTRHRGKRHANPAHHPGLAMIPSGPLFDAAFVVRMDNTSTRILFVLAYKR
jgi:hypothetical protein